MRILAINQFYAPDKAATAQLLAQLCEDLVRAGDEVTVIASRGAYAGEGALPAREVIAGVQVLRPWSTRLGKKSHLHRISDYLSFWATSVLRVASVERPDVILALTTPPMIATGAAMVASARGIPLVTWIQDVYPEAAVKLGALRPGHPLAAVLRRVSTTTHGLTHTSVVLSEKMAERIVAQGQRRERIEVIANWSDGAIVRPIPHAENPFRQERFTDDHFVVLYSGNLGVGHDIATLIEAARILESTHPDVQFLFVGDGARRAEAEERARGLSNVGFLPYQPFEALPFSLSCADLHLVSLREGLEGLLVPSKIYGILAVGRPVVFVGPEESEVAKLITTHDMGWVHAPGDARGVAKAISAAARDIADTRARGERARESFETHYDRPHAVARWRRALDRAAASTRSDPR